ncbi:unnamed protein product [marine sediment metagenome]|uniref:Uncharacterized protein n=1 Tax=marine sediment metagenome TaxID=412755 RepID=X0UNB9_9ZZZZ
MNLYIKASFKQDYDLIEKIIHPDSDYSINRNLAQWQKNEMIGAKMFAIILGLKGMAKYQKIIDTNTAEVGDVMYSIYWPFAKRPVGITILKKDGDVWKVLRNKWVGGKMLEQLSQNPSDTPSYYLCSCDMANKQNQLLAYRFRKKYYELDPDGFWITKSFIEKLKANEEKYETNYEEYERELLAQINTYHAAWRAREYIDLARIFMFHQNNGKAERYLNEAENVFEKEGHRYHLKEQLDQAWHELQLREEGKYVDPLDELDKLRIAK